MCNPIGQTDWQGAVFIYKNDKSGPAAWADVNAIYTSHGGIRGEWHTCKTEFLAGLKAWNVGIDPVNAFLCIYAHMGVPGLNSVGSMTPSAVTWQELANALPHGVQYLWLAGCKSKECLKAWTPLTAPVRHRLLATTESKYWQPLLRVFAAEISITKITFDDQMSAKIAEMEPELSQHTQYFRPTPSGFVED